MATTDNTLSQVSNALPSRRALRLRWNFLYSFIGNSAFASLQFMVMSMLGYFFGGEAAQGRYGLATAIVLPLANCLGFQLRPVYVADIDQRHPYGCYLALRLLASPLIAVGALLWFFALNWDVSALLILAIVIVFRTLENLTDMLFGVYQKNKRMNHIAVTRLLICVCAGFWALGAWWFEAGAEAFLAGLVVGQMVALLGYAVPQAKAMEGNLLVFRWEDLWAILRTAAPMGVVMLLVTLGGVVPRHVIAWLHAGEPLRALELVGQFAASTQLIVIQTIFVTALGNALVPDLAQRLQKDPRRFPRFFFLALGIFTGISLPVATGLFFVGPYLTKVAFNVSYPEVGSVMRLVGVNAMLTSWVLLVGITNTAGRAYKQLMVVQGVKFTVLLGSAFWMLSNWGLPGGVGAIMLANCMGLVVSGVYLYNRYRRNAEAQMRSTLGESIHA